MRILENSEIDLTKEYFREAKKEAEKSSYYIPKCGVVLVKDKAIIGRGFNFPSTDKGLEKYFKDFPMSDLSLDRINCIYAVQGAIVDAIDRDNGEKIKGSTLYFTRLSKEKKIIPAGKPDCTICSKLALDNGVSKWVLFDEFGFCEYDAEEYNDISFGLREWKLK